MTLPMHPHFENAGARAVEAQIAIESIPEVFPEQGIPEFPSSISPERFEALVAEECLIAHEIARVKILAKKAVKDLESRRSRMWWWWGEQLRSFALKKIGKRTPRRFILSGVAQISAKRQPDKIEVRNKDEELFAWGDERKLTTRTVTIKGLTTDEYDELVESLPEGLHDKIETEAKIDSRDVEREWKREWSKAVAADKEKKHPPHVHAERATPPGCVMMLNRGDRITIDATAVGDDE